MAMEKVRRSLPPLDAAALERIALRYVERFATTQGKLTDYLARKLRERGWAEADAPDPGGVAARMAARGYIDDRGWAEAKGAALTRRGLGAGRVAMALRQAGIEAADAAPVREAAAGQAAASALAFARRRRFGPYAPVPADRDLRERQVAAMIRAGHGFAIARKIVDAQPGEVPQFDTHSASMACDDSDPC